MLPPVAVFQDALRGVSSVCSVMETTRTPLRLSMDLKATACSRLRVNLLNFQTKISRKGASGLEA